MKNNEIYIRTVDGVYSVPAVLDKNGNYVLDAYVPKYGFVLKYSFYIEELLNRVIRINKKHYKIMTMYQFQKMKSSQISRDINQKGMRYLGCCWTRKGLEYVAEYKRGDWIGFCDN